MYVTAARNGFHTALAYKWDFLSSSMCTPLFILVQLLLWTTVFRSGGLERASGRSLPEMRSYLLLAGLLWPLLGRIHVDRAVAAGVGTVLLQNWLWHRGVARYSGAGG